MESITSFLSTEKRVTDSWGHVFHDRVISIEEQHISHSEMFTKNFRVMKYKIHMLLKESTHETQTANHNHTLPISRTGKAKRNTSVKEVLCPHVPSANICWWITKRSSGL